MPTSVKDIFISYAHEDTSWMKEVVKRLKNVAECSEERFDYWTDQRIKTGERWGEEIEIALRNARVAIVIATPDFFNSEFIVREELPRLKLRSDEGGVKVASVIARKCQLPPWLEALQVTPAPDQPLNSMKQSAKDDVLLNIATWVQTQLEATSPRTFASSPAQPIQERDVAALIKRMLCANVPETLHDGAARRLVDVLQKRTGATGPDIFYVVRFLIEYRLLASGHDLPLSVFTSAGEPTIDDAQEPVWQALGEVPFQPRPVALDSGPFLQRAFDRAKAWHRYFGALSKAGFRPEEIETVCAVDVRGGALAPQYLLAGLLSHFDENWTPVIEDYARVRRNIPDIAPLLDRLRTSQWLCWLLWGPSIPACTCTHWKPAFAYQYGYGDENNSLPAYLSSDASVVESMLREHANGDRRAVQVESITLRITSGPLSAGSKFAQAQARITRSPDPDAPDDSSQFTQALLLKMTQIKARKAKPDQRAYFTAYVWLMFWITRGADHSDTPGSIVRRDGRSLPEPTSDWQANADEMRENALWDDLLPVFVHANIMDPAVLRFQKTMLIANALQLIAEIWSDDESRPKSSGVGSLQFHLVSASDYAGCGSALAFPPPPGESLVDLMRARLSELRAEGKAFAAAISLPAENEAAEERAPAFRAFLSACHLPELIDAYYDSN